MSKSVPLYVDSYLDVTRKGEQVRISPNVLVSETDLTAEEIKHFQAHKAIRPATMEEYQALKGDEPEVTKAAPAPQQVTVTVQPSGKK